MADEGMMPTHNLCVGRAVPGRKKKAYTQVGVGWWALESEQMMLKINLTLILGPEDTVYVFPKYKATDDAEEPRVAEEPF